MFGESVFTDGMLQDERTYYDVLKQYIEGESNSALIKAHLTSMTGQLPAAYSRHNSSNVLKGFSIRLTVHNECFVATAVASLGPPTSLAGDFDLVLEDDFVEMMSEVGALDALEQLYDEVLWRVEEGKRGT